MILRYFLSLIFLSFLYAESTNKGIIIDADKISYDRLNKSATASGNVNLVKQSRGDNLNLTCEILTAFFDDAGGLLKAVAKRHIIFKKDKAKVVADLCTYNKQANTLLAEGSILLTYQNHKIWGDKLTGDLKVNVFSLTSKNSNGGLVKAYIYANSKGI